MSNIFKMDLPPYAYLMQVLNHTPKVAASYVEIWRHKDKHDRLIVCKTEIRNKFLMTAAKFKNDCLVLVREGLINLEQRGDDDFYTLHIDVVGWGEDED